MPKLQTNPLTRAAMDLQHVLAARIVVAVTAAALAPTIEAAYGKQGAADFRRNMQDLTAKHW